MKVTTVSKKPKFEPITIQITLENEEDVALIDNLCTDECIISSCSTKQETFLMNLHEQLP